MLGVTSIDPDCPEPRAFGTLLLVHVANSGDQSTMRSSMQRYAGSCGNYQPASRARYD